VKQQGPGDSKTSKNIPSSMTYMEEEIEHLMGSTRDQTKFKAGTRYRKSSSLKQIRQDSAAY